MNTYYILTFIIVVLANVLGYWVKSIVKNNGYPVSYFSGHFRDTKNIFKLAKSTNDKNAKIKYLIMGFGEIGLGIILIGLSIGLFLSFPSFNDAACNSFKEFKSYKYDYLVINKYFDSNEHSYPTLILQDKKGNKFKNQDLIMDASGLFDFLNIGDSIKKNQGDSFVNVKNNTLDTTIKVDFGCDKN